MMEKIDCLTTKPVSQLNHFPYRIEDELGEYEIDFSVLRIFERREFVKSYMAVKHANVGNRKTNDLQKFQKNGTKYYRALTVLLVKILKSILSSVNRF